MQKAQDPRPLIHTYNQANPAPLIVNPLITFGLWVRRHFSPTTGLGLHSLRRRSRMRYIGAWLLGVPTGLIVIWFLANHVR